MKKDQMNGRIYHKDWLSIDANDDDNNYGAFTKFLTNDTSRKNKVASDHIMALGEKMMKEIDEKKKNQNKKKEVLIKYIIKKTNKYPPKTLREYELDDVKVIYDEIKYENRSFFKKLLDLF